MILLLPFLLEINSVSARVLLFLVIPGHLVFFYLICLVEGQAVTSSKTFVLLYLVAGMIQVRVASQPTSVVLVPWEVLSRVPIIQRSTQLTQAQRHGLDTEATVLCTTHLVPRLHCTLHTACCTVTAHVAYFTHSVLRMPHAPESCKSSYRCIVFCEGG